MKTISAVLTLAVCGVLFFLERASASALTLVPEVAESTLAGALSRVEQGDADACYEASCYYIRCADIDDEHVAVELARVAADKGNAGGLLNMGVCYYEGIGVERDCAKAAQYFEKSLQLGNLRGLNALAYMYAEGEGVSKDVQKAWQYAERALAQDVPHALSLLCYLYDSQEGGERDFYRLEQIVRDRIEARPDEGEAYYALAGVLERVGDGQSEQMVEIKQTLLKSAELGCASAMRMLAVEYMDAGGYLPRDEEKAMLWCERAVAAGDGQAMLDLAASYYFGEGVEKNWLKTAELTRSAAKLRAPGALCALGQLYRKGEGVVQDYTKAEQYFRKSIAREPDCAEAYVELAVCLLSAYDTSAVACEAFSLAQTGAQLGLAAGFRLLGMAYEEGWAFENGVQLPTDAEKAKLFYTEADEMELEN